MKTTRPDCYSCRYRRGVPGDAHSSCAHPHPTAKGHPRGIAMGWFNFPWNFDPIWLLECSGFTPKKKQEEDAQPS